MTKTVLKEEMEDLCRIATRLHEVASAYEEPPFDPDRYKAVERHSKAYWKASDELENFLARYYNHPLDEWDKINSVVEYTKPDGDIFTPAQMVLMLKDENYTLSPKRHSGL